MVRSIITYPNPILRQRAEECDLFEQFRPGGTDELAQQVQDAVDTLMADPRGAALAANQIGITKRFFVVKPSLARGNNVSEIIINPKIVRRGKMLVTDTEGCLSFPGIRAEVARPRKCEVEYVNLHGEPRTVSLSGFISRVFQHEIDHLDGTLFIDLHLENGNIIRREDA